MNSNPKNISESTVDVVAKEEAPSAAASRGGWRPWGRPKVPVAASVMDNDEKNDDNDDEEEDATTLHKSNTNTSTNTSTNSKQIVPTRSAESEDTGETVKTKEDEENDEDGLEDEEEPVPLAAAVASTQDVIENNTKSGFAPPPPLDELKANDPAQAGDAPTDGVLETKNDVDDEPIIEAGFWSNVTLFRHGTPPNSGNGSGKGVVVVPSGSILPAAPGLVVDSAAAESLVVEETAPTDKDDAAATAAATKEDAVVEKAAVAVAGGWFSRRTAVATKPKPAAPEEKLTVDIEKRGTDLVQDAAAAAAADPPVIAPPKTRGGWFSRSSTKPESPPVIPSPHPEDEFIDAASLPRADSFLSSKPCDDNGDDTKLADDTIGELCGPEQLKREGSIDSIHWTKLQRPDTSTTQDSFARGYSDRTDLNDQSVLEGSSMVEGNMIASHNVSGAFSLVDDVDDDASNVESENRWAIDLNPSADLANSENDSDEEEGSFGTESDDHWQVELDPSVDFASTVADEDDEEIQDGDLTSNDRALVLGDSFAAPYRCIGKTEQVMRTATPELEIVQDSTLTSGGRELIDTENININSDDESVTSELSDDNNERPLIVDDEQDDGDEYSDEDEEREEDELFDVSPVDEVDPIVLVKETVPNDSTRQGSEQPPNDLRGPLLTRRGVVRQATGDSDTLGALLGGGTTGMETPEPTVRQGRRKNEESDIEKERSTPLVTRRGVQRQATGDSDTWGVIVAQADSAITPDPSDAPRRGRRMVSDNTATISADLSNESDPKTKRPLMTRRGVQRQATGDSDTLGLLAANVPVATETKRRGCRKTVGNADDVDDAGTSDDYANDAVDSKNSTEPMLMRRGLQRKATGDSDTWGALLTNSQSAAPPAVERKRRGGRRQAESANVDSDDSAALADVSGVEPSETKGPLLTLRGVQRRSTGDSDTLALLLSRANNPSDIAPIQVDVKCRSVRRTTGSAPDVDDADRSTENRDTHTSQRGNSAGVSEQVLQGIMACPSDETYSKLSMTSFDEVENNEAINAAADELVDDQLERELENDSLPVQSDMKDVSDELEDTPSLEAGIDSGDVESSVETNEAIHAAVHEQVVDELAIDLESDSLPIQSVVDKLFTKFGGILLPENVDKSCDAEPSLELPEITKDLGIDESNEAEAFKPTVAADKVETSDAMDAIDELATEVECDSPPIQSEVDKVAAEFEDTPLPEHVDRSCDTKPEITKDLGIDESNEAEAFKQTVAADQVEINEVMDAVADEPTDNELATEVDSDSLPIQSEVEELVAEFEGTPSPENVNESCDAESLLEESEIKDDLGIDESNEAEAFKQTVVADQVEINEVMDAVADEPVDNELAPELESNSLLNHSEVEEIADAFQGTPLPEHVDESCDAESSLEESEIKDVNESDEAEAFEPTIACDKVEINVEMDATADEPVDDELAPELDSDSLLNHSEVEEIADEFEDTPLPENVDESCDAKLSLEESEIKDVDESDKTEAFVPTIAYDIVETNVKMDAAVDEPVDNELAPELDSDSLLNHSEVEEIADEFEDTPLPENVDESCDAKLSLEESEIKDVDESDKTEAFVPTIAYDKVETNVEMDAAADEPVDNELAPELGSDSLLNHSEVEEIADAFQGTPLPEHVDESCDAEPSLEESKIKDVNESDEAEAFEPTIACDEIEINVEMDATADEPDVDELASEVECDSLPIQSEVDEIVTGFDDIPLPEVIEESSDAEPSLEESAINQDRGLAGKDESEVFESSVNSDDVETNIELDAAADEPLDEEFATESESDSLFIQQEVEKVATELKETSSLEAINESCDTEPSLEVPQITEDCGIDDTDKAEAFQPMVACDELETCEPMVDCDKVESNEEMDSVADELADDQLEIELDNDSPPVHMKEVSDEFEDTPSPEKVVMSGYTEPSLEVPETTEDRGIDENDEAEAFDPTIASDDVKTNEAIDAALDESVVDALTTGLESDSLPIQSDVKEVTAEFEDTPSSEKVESGYAEPSLEVPVVEITEDRGIDENDEVEALKSAFTCNEVETNQEMDAVADKPVNEEFATELEGDSLPNHSVVDAVIAELAEFEDTPLPENVDETCDAEPSLELPEITEDRDNAESMETGAFEPTVAAVEVETNKAVDAPVDEPVVDERATDVESDSPPIQSVVDEVVAEFEDTMLPEVVNECCDAEPSLEEPKITEDCCIAQNDEVEAIEQTVAADEGQTNEAMDAVVDKLEHHELTTEVELVSLSVQTKMDEEVTEFEDPSLAEAVEHAEKSLEAPEVTKDRIITVYDEVEAFKPTVACDEDETTEVEAFEPTVACDRDETNDLIDMATEKPVDNEPAGIAESDEVDAFEPMVAADNVETNDAMDTVVDEPADDEIATNVESDSLPIQSTVEVTPLPAAVNESYNTEHSLEVPEITEDCDIADEVDAFEPNGAEEVENKEAKTVEADEPPDDGLTTDAERDYLPILSEGIDTPLPIAIDESFDAEPSLKEPEIREEVAVLQPAVAADKVQTNEVTDTAADESANDALATDKEIEYVPVESDVEDVATDFVDTPLPEAVDESCDQSKVEVTPLPAAVNESYDTEHSLEVPEITEDCDIADEVDAFEPNGACEEVESKEAMTVEADEPPDDGLTTDAERDHLPILSEGVDTPLPIAIDESFDAEPSLEEPEIREEVAVLQPTVAADKVQTNEVTDTAADESANDALATDKEIECVPVESDVEDVATDFVDTPLPEAVDESCDAEPFLEEPEITQDHGIAHNDKVDAIEPMVAADELENNDAMDTPTNDELATDKESEYVPVESDMEEVATPLPEAVDESCDAEPSLEEPEITQDRGVSENDEVEAIEPTVAADEIDNNDAMDTATELESDSLPILSGPEELATEFVDTPLPEAVVVSCDVEPSFEESEITQNHGIAENDEIEAIEHTVAADDVENNDEMDTSADNELATEVESVTLPNLSGVEEVPNDFVYTALPEAVDESCDTEPSLEEPEITQNHGIAQNDGIEAIEPMVTAEEVENNDAMDTPADDELTTEVESVTLPILSGMKGLATEFEDTPLPEAVDESCDAEPSLEKPKITENRGISENDEVDAIESTVSCDEIETNEAIDAIVDELVDDELKSELESADQSILSKVEAVATEFEDTPSPKVVDKSCDAEKAMAVPEITEDCGIFETKEKVALQQSGRDSFSLTSARRLLIPIAFLHDSGQTSNEIKDVAMVPVVHAQKTARKIPTPQELPSTGRLSDCSTDQMLCPNRFVAVSEVNLSDAGSRDMPAQMVTVNSGIDTCCVLTPSVVKRNNEVSSLAVFGGEFNSDVKNSVHASVRDSNTAVQRTMSITGRPKLRKVAIPAAFGGAKAHSRTSLADEKAASSSITKTRVVVPVVHLTHDISTLSLAQLNDILHAEASNVTIARSDSANTKISTISSEKSGYMKTMKLTTPPMFGGLGGPSQKSSVESIDNLREVKLLDSTSKISAESSQLWAANEPSTKAVSAKNQKLPIPPVYGGSVAPIPSLTTSEHDLNFGNNKHVTSNKNLKTIDPSEVFSAENSNTSGNAEVDSSSLLPQTNAQEKKPRKNKLAIPAAFVKCLAQDNKPPSPRAFLKKKLVIPSAFGGGS